MDTGNILQGIGLFVCVGAIVLVALVAFAMRSLANRRGQNQSTMWNTPGPEQPRYDDPNIQSSGGFGGVPATGKNVDVYEADQELGRRPLNVDRTRDSGQARSGGGFGGSAEPRREDDDDNVRSSGGFGGG